MKRLLMTGSSRALQVLSFMSRKGTVSRFMDKFILLIIPVTGLFSLSNSKNYL